MVNRALLVSSWALAALAVACSSTTVIDAPDADAGRSADLSCADLAKARCAKLQECSSHQLTTREGDLATCETREKAACVAALAAPSTGSTPATVGACATATAATACKEFLGNTPVPACVAKVGGLADGAACGYSSQCRSTFCASPKGAPCGTCAAPPRAGDSCATVGCGPTLACGKSKVCVAYVGSGQACDGDLPCDAGLSCVTAKGAPKGTCQALGASEGATCDPKEQTAPGCSRQAGLWCQGTGTCAKISGYAKGGEPCGLLDPATFRSCAGGTCVAAAGSGGAGTCVADVGAGAACDTGNDGASCMTGFRCAVSGDGGADAGSSGACVSPASCK